jgi:hypothetical protein
MFDGRMLMELPQDDWVVWSAFSGGICLRNPYETVNSYLRLRR